ncbi:hypothetical protein N9D87_00330 [bacterium]|nr:hypothetical protein [bacterium]
MELSYFELLQMVDVSISRLESVFQFWLSATFAAIVASHLAGDKLTKVYAGMLSSLYLVFTFSVIVRMIAWRDTLQGYFAALSAIRGEQGGAGMMSLVNNSIWATVLLGTIATVVFIWHSYLTSKQDLASGSNDEPLGSESESTL